MSEQSKHQPPRPLRITASNPEDLAAGPPATIGPLVPGPPEAPESGIMTFAGGPQAYYYEREWYPDGTEAFTARRIDVFGSESHQP